MFRILSAWFLFGLVWTHPSLSQSKPEGQAVTPAADATATPLNKALDEALALYRKGSLPAAVERYQKILAGNPKSPDGYAWLARTYLKQGDVARAAETIEKGLTLADDPKLHVAQGEVLFRQGKISDGEHEWVMVINAHLPEPRAFLGMFRVRWCMSLYKQAKTMIDHAHDLDPSDPDIQDAWMSTLTRAERIQYLEQHLPKAGGANASDIDDTQKYLSLLKKRAQESRRPCRLVSKVTSTETVLNRLLLNADHLRGYGLTVAVNGHKANLMVDTGASGILIDRGIADRAGIKVEYQTRIGGIGDQGSKSGHVGIADSIKIGELEFQNCPVEVLERRTVVGEEGLIGADVFKDFLVDLDFAEQKLRLSELPQRPGEQAGPKGLVDDYDDGSDASPSGATDAAAGTGGKPQTPSKSRFEDAYIAAEMKSFTRVYRFGHMILVPTKIGDVPNQLFLLDSGSFDNQITPAAAKLTTKTYTEDNASIQGLNGYVKPENLFR